MFLVNRRPTSTPDVPRPSRGVSVHLGRETWGTGQDNWRRERDVVKDLRKLALDPPVDSSRTGKSSSTHLRSVETRPETWPYPLGLHLGLCVRRELPRLPPFLSSRTRPCRDPGTFHEVVSQVRVADRDPGTYHEIVSQTRVAVRESRLPL